MKEIEYISYWHFNRWQWREERHHKYQRPFSEIWLFVGRIYVPRIGFFGIKHPLSIGTLNSFKNLARYENILFLAKTWTLTNLYERIFGRWKTVILFVWRGWFTRRFFRWNPGGGRDLPFPIMKMVGRVKVEVINWMEFFLER